MGRAPKVLIHFGKPSETTWTVVGTDLPSGVYRLPHSSASPQLFLDKNLVGIDPRDVSGPWVVLLPC